MSDSTLASDSLDSLYHDHHGWLVGWLRRRLRCSEHAADIAQDTYLRVLSKDAPVVIREPRGLLTTIARGLILNQRRRQRIEQAYLESLALRHDSLAPSPETQALIVETLFEMDRLLDGLPQPVRQAFLMSQLDGLKQSEIAGRLGVSVPTVKRYIARALEQCCFA